MDITTILIVSNFSILILGAFPMGKMQNDMIKTLYYKYNDIWRELGEPGGWFWRPPGRGWVENEILKMKFWNKNSYSFEKSNIIPKELLGFHRRYYLFLGVVIAILILLNISINLIFWEAGHGN